jgi:lipopolysaccharide export system permease protein
LRRILDRYILREVVLSWAAVTGVLLALLLTHQLAEVLERAAENQYPREVVFKLIGLGALQNLSIIMPVGLLLGVVLAFGRLYHDSEMTAIAACGVRPMRLYVPVTLFAVVIAAVVAWLTLFLSPQATGQTLALRSEALRAGQFSPVAPGRFRTFGGGDAVVYAESVDADGTLANVFVERSRDNRVEVALALRARHTVGADGMTHTITLYEGERFEGTPGSPRFRIVRFAEHVIPVQVPPLMDSATRMETLPTRELLTSSDPERRAQLHGRIALPVMCLVLTLLAIPLSRLRPRQGRYARVWLAVLVYFVYSNLISAGEVWLARGIVPEYLGLWWVHAAAVLLILLVIGAPSVTARLRYRGFAHAPA